MIRIASALLALSLSNAALAGSTACLSAAHEVAEPYPAAYQSGFLNPATGPDRPVHLPANAVGVLYHSNERPPLSAFRIIDIASGASLPVRLSALKAGLPPPPQYETVAPGTKADIVYRVGPQGGFKVGATYLIDGYSTFAPKTYVHIDAAVIDARQLIAQLTLRLPRSVNREAVFGSGPCWNGSDIALVQSIDYVVPAQLLPYRDLLFSSVLNQEGMQWRSLAALDSSRRSPSEPTNNWPSRGLPERDYFTTVAAYAGRPRSSKLVASVGLLEVDEAFYTSGALAFTLDPAKAAARDSLDLLREALRSNDPARIRDQLALTPVRDADSALLNRTEPQLPGFADSFSGQQRYLDLLHTSVRLLGHADAAVRSAAAGALVRVMRAGAHGARLSKLVAAALIRAFSDPAREVRASALHSLLDLEEREGSYYSCEITNRIRIFSGCFDTKSLVPAIPALVTLLASPARRAQDYQVESILRALSSRSDLTIHALMAAPDSQRNRDMLYVLAYESRLARRLLGEAISSDDAETSRRASAAMRELISGAKGREVYAAPFPPGPPGSYPPLARPGLHGALSRE